MINKLYIEKTEIATLVNKTVITVIVITVHAILSLKGLKSTT